MMITCTEIVNGRKNFLELVRAMENSGWAVRQVVSDELGIIVVFEMERR